MPTLLPSVIQPIRCSRIEPGDFKHSEHRGGRGVLNGARCRARQGFTLLELLVVLVIIAISAALVSLALPDADGQTLDREAARFIYAVELARLEARVAGARVELVVHPDTGKPHFTGLPPHAQSKENSTQSSNSLSERVPQGFLDERTRMEIIKNKRSVLKTNLGPEPIIEGFEAVLRLGERSVTLRTDGLGVLDWPKEVAP